MQPYAYTNVTEEIIRSYKNYISNKKEAEAFGK